MWPKWPIISLLFLVATPLGILGESPGDTTPSDEAAFVGSTSPSTTPSPKPEETTDRLINGDLRKAARVEPMSGGSEQKRGDEEQYDVIDVEAATGTGAGTGAGAGAAGRPKSGQTTRIYTTGEVDESFWLKHLGDDFKHAIHLQVGGTNEEYNRLINQTQNGVHEEVHHEYLPGAERPDGEVASSPPPPRIASGGYFRGSQQQSLDSRSLAMKQQFIHQQTQQQQRQQQQHYNYALQHTQLYTPRTQSQQQRHQHQHQHHHRQLHPQLHPQQHRHQQQHQYRVTPQHTQIRYQKPQQHGYIINSSEDQLHASQTNSAPVRSGSEGGGGAVGYEEEGDSLNSQLTFKSPFNDYGSRPTRDLAYLLYRRGL